ncbi:cyclin-dependent kinase-like 1 isoform X2 [Dysidea avara]|uniref:cyclin-dependent kinase-like 1 isoform X2 n=1 Tax=Dysidea avara TaxID=196820 RepID=UPI00332AD2F7
MLVTKMAVSERQLRSLKLPAVKRTSRIEPIGTGSYANVYEVMVHGTRCAAKEMHPILTNEMRKSDFLDECVRCSRIRHPNVVQFLGIHYPSPDAELPWLVMELMHISLTGLIEKYEREDFPFHFKLSILMDTCQGIQFLHSQNIIHRDLSSNNILLTKHLVAKVSDLGVAKVIPPGFHRHTMVPGTTAFMPPEALIDEPVYSLPIDVFSIGCVCVHVVSMKWPMPKNQVTAARTILSEIERRVNYLADMTRYPKLKQLAEHCLQDKPEDRSDIGEVIKCLKGVYYDHKSHEYEDVIELFKHVIALDDHSIQQMATNNQLITMERRESHRKDRMLQQKDQQLRQKDQQLAEKYQNMLQKDKLLRQKDQEIAKRDELLRQLREQLSQKDQNSSMELRGLQKMAEGSRTYSTPLLRCGNTNIFIYAGRQKQRLRKGLFSTFSGGLNVFNGPVKGTTIKFDAPRGNDTVVRNGTNQNVVTKLQRICAMKQYEYYSMEELRFADYQKQRKKRSMYGN